MAGSETLGVVLAGGLARRMAGGDKARICVGGTPLLDRVVARLRPQCSGLIVNANSDPARFADSGLPVVADSIPDHQGPLAGILAGLDWAADHAPQIAWVASAPTDCPFLPFDLVARLHQARIEAGATLACARSDARLHPVIALWPVAQRDELRRALVRDGVRKVEQWIARYHYGIADWPTAPIDPFFNVNTPADRVEADRLAALHPRL